MLKRLLAVIIVALLAPLPTVWLLYNYGEWLFARFQDIGLVEGAAGVGATVFVGIAAMVLIGGAFVYFAVEGDKVWGWIKTGKFHA